MKGPHSKETKEKIRKSILKKIKDGQWTPSTDAMVANRKDYYAYGGEAPMKGKKKSPDAYSFPEGKDNPRWKGGLSKDRIHRNKTKTAYRHKNGEISVWSFRYD